MSIFSQTAQVAGSRVAFLGEEVHCALGADVDACLDGLRQPMQAPELLTCKATAEALQIPYKLLHDRPLAKAEQRLLTTVTEVAESALARAGLNEQQRRSMGLFIGSSSYDVGKSEQEFQQELADGLAAIPLRDPGFGRLASQLLDELGIRGPDFSINTACTASANALVAAVEQVEAGLLDYALVLGIELYNDITALGFQGLGLLSQSYMRPFDAERKGLVLGEGVSALVVGRVSDNDRPRFYLRGGASLCDPYSISASAPDGSTIHAVMLKALGDAGLQAEDIAAIKVHGTASLSNDEAESAGMLSLFNPMPPVAALKPFIGHTLGACGLTELILFYRALEAGFLIATPGIAANSEALGIQLNQQYQPVDGQHFMLNFFGFGGNNCSLIVSKTDGGEQ